jgi:hypothetical protein
MTTITPSSLINPTEKTIKNWNCAFIAVEGPNVIDKLSLEDLAIPYESQYRSRIILKAGESNKLLYGFIGKAVTFLMIKVTYDSLNDPYYQYEQEKYNIFYSFENDPIERPLNRLMILTGSLEDKIPQIYLSNPLGYDVTLDILHATADSEYDEVETNGYQPHFNITNITNSYTGLTSDEYVRCSGGTSGSTYTVYLPIATGTGNIFMIKNITNGTITIEAQNSQTVDYSLTPIVLNQFDVLKLIDAGDNNWDKI